jgi:hypothetical protein
MQDPWILGSPVSGAEGVSAPFRVSVIHGHCRAGQFVAPIEAKRYPPIGGCRIQIREAGLLICYLLVDGGAKYRPPPEPPGASLAG